MKYVDITATKNRNKSQRSSRISGKSRSMHAGFPLSIQKVFAKKGKKKINYKLRFYLVIVLIGCSSLLYIRHQITTETDSVFKDVYALLSPYIPKLSVSLQKKKNSTQPQPPQPTLPKTKSQKKHRFSGGSVSNPQQQQSSQSSSLASSSKRNRSPSAISKSLAQPIVYYLPKIGDQNRIEMAALKGTFMLSPQKENLYKDVISALLRYEPRSKDHRHKDVVQVFSEEVRLKKAWIENKVLLLDFNEPFEKNRYGNRGLFIQIQQLLWTLFQSPLLEGQFDSISILVDGKRKQQIGGDGMPLKPFYVKTDMRRYIHAR